MSAQGYRHEVRYKDLTSEAETHPAQPHRALESGCRRVLDSAQGCTGMADTTRRVSRFSICRPIHEGSSHVLAAGAQAGHAWARHSPFPGQVLLRSALKPVPLSRARPNHGLEGSAQQLRCWVPVALRAPVPAQPERCAAWRCIDSRAIPGVI